MLEHGRIQDKERIIDVVRAKILDFAMDKHSSSNLSLCKLAAALEQQTYRRNLWQAGERNNLFGWLRQCRHFPALVPMRFCSNWPWSTHLVSLTH